MAQGKLTALIEIFSQVRDFRSPQGRRHPLSALFTLVFLGLLPRIREMAVLQRWTETNWELLREPLGFTHEDGHWTRRPGVAEWLTQLTSAALSAPPDYPSASAPTASPSNRFTDLNSSASAENAILLDKSDYCRLLSRQSLGRPHSLWLPVESEKP